MASKVSATAMMRAPSGIAVAGEAGGVAGAVEPLVVMADHRGDGRVADAAGHVGAVAGVAADDRELLVGEATGLVEDLARRVELADVVQRGGGAHPRDLVRGKAELWPRSARRAA